MIADFRKLVLAGVSIGLLCVTAPTHAETYFPFDTGVDSENFTSLPASVAGSNTWYVLYCQDVGTLADNDILVVMGESQIQQPSATAGIFVGAKLSRTSTPCSDIAMGGYVLPTTNVQTLGGENGIGVSENEYRAVSPKGATVLISGHDTYEYVTYSVTASQIMDVPPGTGELQVLKIVP